MDVCDGRYCRKLAEPVFPTSVYEAAMAFSIGGILWALRKRVQVPAMLFFIYLIFNGTERFFIEKIRVNERYDALSFSFTQAELIAVLIFAAGVAGTIWLALKSKR